MHWLSQINKESYTILGVFVFIYGIVVFFEKKVYVSIGYILLGVVLISICRPYIVQELFIATLLLSFLLILYAIKRIECLYLGLTLLCLSFTFIPFMSGSMSDRNLSFISYSNVADMNKYAIWSRSSWLPDFVDEKLFSLSFSKAPFELLKGNSNATVRSLLLVDESVFHSAKDLFVYMPRALQLALFSPFPKDWVFSSEINDGSVFRLMTSFEMIVAYVCFIFLSIGLFKYHHLKFIVPVYYLLVVMLVYGLAIPHVGILYRYKYSCFMLLLTLGAAFLIRYLAERGWICFFGYEENK